MDAKAATGRTLYEHQLDPGDLLNEGAMFVGVAIWTLAPDICHFYEREGVTVSCRRLL